MVSADEVKVPLHEQILRDPLLLEALLVLVGLIVLALFAAWIRRVGREGQRRRAVHNFVQGIDCVVRRDWEGAVGPLEQVLACDPENVEARVALGDCYRELGRAAEAERLHMEALGAFGDDRLHTRISLARDHLAQGRPDQALPFLEQVLGLEPRQADALHLFAEAAQELRRYSEAARARRQLLLILEGPGQEARREALRRKIGKDLALAATAQEGEGRFSQALENFREALSWNPALTLARAGMVRCLARIGQGRSTPKVLQEQLEEMRELCSQPGFLFLPSAHEAVGSLGEERPLERLALPGSGEEQAQPLPLAEISPAQAALVATLLQREAPYFCGACDLALAFFSQACPGCGALGSLLPGEPGFLAELGAVDPILDEVEENEAFLLRQVAALYAGHDRARERLLEAGSRALPVLHEELQSREDPGPLLQVLAQAGPGILEEFFEIHRRRRANRPSFLGGLLGAIGRRRRLLSLVARAFGEQPEAEAFFLGLAESTDEEERRAVLDYFVAAARPAAFEQLQAFAPVELFNHLAHARSEDLVPLLLQVRPADYLVEWVLVDPALSIEEALVEAFTRARDRQALGLVLRERGFHPGVERSLQALLCHEGVRQEARAVLASFGPEALVHRVPVLLDPETPEEVRENLGRLLCAEGEAAVEPILRGLGPRTAPIDDRALDLLAEIGLPAVAALERVYAGEGGFMARFPGLRRRHMRRREIVLRALARIPGPESEALLGRLLAGESEPALRALGERLLRERRGP